MVKVSWLKDKLYFTLKKKPDKSKFMHVCPGQFNVIFSRPHYTSRIHQAVVRLPSAEELHSSLLSNYTPNRGELWRGGIRGEESDWKMEERLRVGGKHSGEQVQMWRLTLRDSEKEKRALKCVWERLTGLTEESGSAKCKKRVGGRKKEKEREESLLSLSRCSFFLSSPANRDRASQTGVRRRVPALRRWICEDVKKTRMDDATCKSARKLEIFLLFFFGRWEILNSHMFHRRSQLLTLGIA